MLFCSHCGAQLRDGEDLCRECGTKRATAGWALATELCTSCEEPTARGWRYCISCGEPTTVVSQGRSVRVDASQVQSWFADLLPVDEAPPITTEGDAPQVVATPPTERAPEPVPQRRGVYTSPAMAAGTAQRVLLSTAIISFIAAAALWVLNGRLEAFKNTQPGTFDSALSVARLADWGTRPLTLLAIGLSVWYLMRWTAIAYGNIFSFGRTSLRLPQTAIPWAFFVPGLNAVAPRRLINDAWRAADSGMYGGQDWMLQHGNRWTNTAWTLGAAAAVFHLVGWRIGNGTVDEAMASNRWAMLGYVAVALAMLGSVMMVQRVTDRQEARNRELEKVSP